MGALDILVVEDEPETRDALLDLLEHEGFEAEGAANGAEALALLEQAKRPRLILLDLIMPVMDGWEFCRQMSARPELAEIPVAIVSATGERRSLPERRKNAGLFQKPLNLQQLLKVVHSYCD